MSAFERFALDNGLTCLIQSLPSVASVSLSVVVDAGSRHESESEAGLSHLIEHMVFQGTPKRDTRELSRVLSAVGGTLDAYTSRESTAFYAKVPAPHLALALDVLADMLGCSRFLPAHLEKEKKVIYEEIRMYEDEPEELVHDAFSGALWPAHALGRPILGTRARIRRHARGDLRKFMQKHYRPHRMLISVAGCVKPAEVKAVVRRLFGPWAARPEKTDAPLAPMPSARPAATNFFRKQEQAHICLGVQSFPFADPRRLALLGVSNILGGGTNSRLFYEVRERRALAYSVYSFVDFYQDTGMTGVYAACHPRKVRETVQVIADEIRRLQDRPVTLQEWKDLREQMKGNLLLSLESTSAHMWRMVQHEMYLKAHPSTATILRQVDRLTREALQQAARDVFGAQPLTLSVVGPVTSRQLPVLN